MRKNLSCRMFVLSCFVLSLTASLMAAPGNVLHTFQGGSGGQNPAVAPVIDSAGNLFGVARTDGEMVPVYELSPSGGGWNYQVIYQFPTAVWASQLLLDSSGNLYGTTNQGGTYNGGSVFELTNNAGTWSASTLYSFGGSSTDGANPIAGLVFDSTGNLYGTTENGGSFGKGTVFELSPNGSGGWSESVLHEFQGQPDGATPASEVTFDKSGNLFGTTLEGGNVEQQYCYAGFQGCGTLYELTPGAGGWTESIVHNFGAKIPDGRRPASAVSIDSHGDLFGTTSLGGVCGGDCGIAYAISPGPGGVWTEHIVASFDGQNGLGFAPSTGILFDARGNAYGATAYGGPKNCGTIYALHPKSEGFTAAFLYDFTGGADGCYPNSLTFDGTGTNVYGTANNGGNANGSNGDGTVFVGHISAN